MMVTTTSQSIRKTEEEKKEPVRGFSNSYSRSWQNRNSFLPASLR
jgi:hypothetical protein